MKLANWFLFVSYLILFKLERNRLRGINFTELTIGWSVLMHHPQYWFFPHSPSIKTWLCARGLLQVFFSVAVTHQVITELLHDVGSLLGGCGLFIDWDYDGCGEKQGDMSKSLRAVWSIGGDSPFSVLMQCRPLLFFLALRTLSVPERKMNLMPDSVMPLAWKNSGDE